MELADKIVVITGAAKGLGKALAEEFTKAHAKVVSSDIDSDADMMADVTKESDVKRLAIQTVEKFGRIDIWVNNAGIQIPPSPVEEVDLERAHKVFDVNLFGTLLGTKYALRQMKQQGTGYIVNMLSTAALTPKSRLSVYSSSKYAIDGLAKSLRIELEDSDIKVLSVYPGGTQTDLYSGFTPADFDKYMKPADVAIKIVANLKKENPEEELIIKRPQ